MIGDRCILWSSGHCRYLQGSNRAAVPLVSFDLPPGPITYFEPYSLGGRYRTSQRCLLRSGPLLHLRGRCFARACQARVFQRRRQISVAFESNGDGGDVEVPENIRVAVFRIMQESLNNARKNAQAETIRVTLDLQPKRVRLDVQDDGVGFDVPPFLGAYVDDGHLGLVSMREWAEEVDGHLQLESGSEGGTRVLLEIPLS